MKTLEEIELVNQEVKKFVGILEEFPELQDSVLPLLYDWEAAFDQYLELGTDESIQALEVQRQRFFVLYNRLMQVCK